MVFVVFQLGRDRYALDASRVVEVLPLVNIRRIPEAPPGVAGFFNCRGRPVPAIDMSELTQGRRSLELLSTRLFVINHPDDSGRNHLLGLIVEHATQTIQRDRREFVEPELNLGGASYLGPVLFEGGGVIHLILEQRLLPAEIRDIVTSDKLSIAT